MAAELNHRQRASLLHAIRPHSVYEIAGHQTAHRVTYPTARTDLLGLVKLRLMAKDKQGKSFAFRPVPDLAQLLER